MFEEFIDVSNLSCRSSSKRQVTEMLKNYILKKYRDYIVDSLLGVSLDTALKQVAELD